MTTYMWHVSLTTQRREHEELCQTNTKQHTTIAITIGVIMYIMYCFRRIPFEVVCTYGQVVRQDVSVQRI